MALQGNTTTIGGSTWCVYTKHGYLTKLGYLV